MKNNRNVVSEETDKVLCEYLLSDLRHRTLKHYKFVKKLSFPESPRKVTNRLAYLKRHNNYFLKRCKSHKLFASCSADTYSESDSDSDSETESESEEEPLPTKKTQTPKDKKMATDFSKFMVRIAGGRIFCAIQLPADYDGDITVSPDRTEVHVEYTYTKANHCTAGNHLVGYGANYSNHVFFNDMQVALENVWNALRDGEYEDDDIISATERGNLMVLTKRVFTLPYKVKPAFYDLDRNEQQPVVDTLQTGDWAHFVLERQDNRATPGRSRIRRRNAPGIPRHPRDDDMEDEANLEQQQRGPAL